MITRAML
jgi:hypothetical protein